MSAEAEPAVMVVELLPVIFHRLRPGIVGIAFVMMNLLSVRIEQWFAMCPVPAVLLHPMEVVEEVVEDAKEKVALEVQMTQSRVMVQEVIVISQSVPKHVVTSLLLGISVIIVGDHIAAAMPYVLVFAIPVFVALVGAPT